MVTAAKPNVETTPPTGVAVSWGPQTLQLRDEEVFGTTGAALCSRFLLRVFSVQEVRSVQIDRPRSTAVIRFEQGKAATVDLMQRLAAALRGTFEPLPGAPGVSLLPQDLAKSKLTIHRHRGLLSTWEVVDEQPGRLSLRHEVMASDSALARRIAHRIESVHGVLSSVVRPLTGTLKICFDPTQTRPERLLRAVEAAPDSLPIEMAPHRNRSPSGLAWSTRPWRFRWSAISLSPRSGRRPPRWWSARTSRCSAPRQASLVAASSACRCCTRPLPRERLPPGSSFLGPR